MLPHFAELDSSLLVGFVSNNDELSSDNDFRVQVLFEVTLCCIQCIVMWLHYCMHTDMISFSNQIKLCSENA